ncbi:MAG: ABC transporter permease, partial [Spirochaetales bacterium]|nr:ABC transporter permease [Spirochaetales bacterium]
KLFLREPAALFFTLIFPILMLVVFGAIYGNEPSEFFGGFGYVDTIGPAFIGLVIAMTGFTSIPGVVASYRERGVLKRLKASPVSSATLLTAWIVVYTLVTVIGSGLMLVVGRLAFNMQFPGKWYLVAAFAVLSMISIFAVGFVIASLAPTVRTAETTGMAIYFPMIFLSGATIPVQVFPEGLRKGIQFLPMTHIVELLQGIWFGNPVSDFLINIFVITGLALVGVAVSAATFRWE